MFSRWYLTHLFHFLFYYLKQSTKSSFEIAIKCLINIHLNLAQSEISILLTAIVVLVKASSRMAPKSALEELELSELNEYDVRRDKWTIEMTVISRSISL